MKCEFCKKEFESNDNRKRLKRFCSLKCAKAFSNSSKSIKLEAEKIREENKKLNDSIKRICKYCGKEYYGSWTKSGQSDFCSRECSRGYSTKAKRAEINKKISDKLKGKRYVLVENKKYHTDRKYKTKPLKQSPRIIEKINCPICGKPLTDDQIVGKRKTCSIECGRKLSVQKLLASGHYTRNGGFRKRSVRSVYGYYKGIYCASTYELVYLIYSLDNNIPIERNTEYFEYVIDGVIKKYYPDFKINDKYIEIKNYHREEVDIKAESVLALNKEIEILYYDDLEHMMCYIDEKYGTFHNRKSNNYQTLYDDYKPKFTFICEHCGKEVSTDNKRTKHRFCSKECGAKHGHKNTLEFINKEDIKKELFPVPNHKGFWYAKDTSLYSSNFIRKDGKWLKCKLSFSNSGKPEYRIRGKRFSLEKLNKLCKFQN